jgi:hypothetical protein
VGFFFFNESQTNDLENNLIAVGRQMTKQDSKALEEICVQMQVAKHSCLCSASFI